MAVDNGQPDRRQIVRMTDRVLFYCSSVSPERFRAVADDFRRGIPLHNQEGLQEIRMHFGAQSALAKLRERDEDLAYLLQHLDRKIDLLHGELKKGKSWLDKLRLQEVSLSGGGIGFLSRKRREPGDLLELHIVLQPQSQYIYCFGEVVHCGPVRDGFRLSAQFILLADDDHEQLIQHTFRLQSLALRNRRLEK